MAAMCFIMWWLGVRRSFGDRCGEWRCLSSSRTAVLAVNSDNVVGSLAASAKVFVHLEIVLSFGMLDCSCKYTHQWHRSLRIWSPSAASSLSFSPTALLVCSFFLKICIMHSWYRSQKQDYPGIVGRARCYSECGLVEGAATPTSCCLCSI
jgi:hypothetical protein